MSVFGKSDLTWPEHPDRILLEAIAEQHAEWDRWDQTRRQGGIAKLLETWSGIASKRLDERIAKARPETLGGLVAKARYALRGWKRRGDTRWGDHGALQAATLEQVLEVLERMYEVDTPSDS